MEVGKDAHLRQVAEAFPQSCFPLAGEKLERAEVHLLAHSGGDDIGEL